MANKANQHAGHAGPERHGAEPVARDDPHQGDHRVQGRRRRRAGRQPGGQRGRTAVREGRHGVHLGLGDASGADHERGEQDVLPRRPQRQRPGSEGRATTSSTTSSPRPGSTILIVDDQEAYSQGLVSVMSPILSAGRLHGRPRELQRQRHRCDAAERPLGAGDGARQQQRARRDRALAVRQQRGAVRPDDPGSRARASRCSAPTAPTRPASSTSRAPTCRTSAPTSRGTRARSTSRSSRASRSTAPTARSACRPGRPRP